MIKVLLEYIDIVRGLHHAVGTTGGHVALNCHGKKKWKRLSISIIILADKY